MGKAGSFIAHLRMLHYSRWRVMSIITEREYLVTYACLRVSDKARARCDALPSLSGQMGSVTFHPGQDEELQEGTARSLWPVGYPLHALECSALSGTQRIDQQPQPQTLC